MFEQLMKRSDWIWMYKMGRFAPERRAFLCHLNEQGTVCAPLKISTSFCSRLRSA